MANLIFGGHKIGSSSLQFSAARGVLSEVENTTQSVGASDGEMLIRSNLKSRIIPVTYDFLALSRREFERQLAPLLYSSGVQKLIIDDRPDEFWYAKVDGKIDMDRAYFLGTGTINFLVPDGIAHSVATQTADNMPYKDVPVNMLTNSSTVQGWTNYSAWTATGDKYDGLVVFKRNSQWLGLYQFVNIAQTPSAYTWSSFVKVDEGVNPSGITVYWNAYDINGNVINGAGVNIDNKISSSWSRISWTLPTSLIPDGTRGINIRLEKAAADGNYVYIAGIKIEKGTSASPWSPNPADPEYYADTITVPNAGTYPSEPVITATINGDDGVLTAINNQGSVLQFGSPDDADGFVKQKSERVYHLDFNQTPTGVTLNNGVTAFPYYEHGNDANVQSGPFGYANGIAYPSTERTASNYWNGPSMSGTIPKNSNGSNTANFQFVNRVNVDTSGPEVGRFEFNLTYKGKIVASLALFDDSPANDQLVFSGTLFDGKDAKMVFFDLLPRNYYRGGNYNAVITKMGNKLTFRLDRLDLGDGGIEPVDIGGFPAMPIDGWTAWFPGFSDQRGWSINWQDSYFEWINVDYWDDIPNRFKDGDVVKIDVANRRVLVNGAEDRTLQTIGNDWGGFKIQPGNNTIELLTSSWAKQCKAEVSWQEAWL
ncbi:phage tail family protein [Lacticaseibacillus paracasei subsp. paracasei]|uniref:distal tail protein Dit n=1 Tax=Lacticaseibacillus paracasei TaxID=1597 RepID=UPI001F417752|nr:distal tail protein Dit [Lacticaseibacillus paracasei]UJS06760.1 phage tail family protein [Lacticaseibacillus paracasei subsp. paracasei]